MSHTRKPCRRVFGTPLPVVALLHQFSQLTRLLLHETCARIELYRFPRPQPFQVILLGSCMYSRCFPPLRRLSEGAAEALAALGAWSLSSPA